VETSAGNYQCGFMLGKSTPDHLHSVRQLLEKVKEYGVNMYSMSVDFKAGLYKAMEEFHIPRKLRCLVE
jgi:hypothetical protein